MPAAQLFEKAQVGVFSCSKPPDFWANIVRIVEGL
jgi:hypothetical protein